MASSDDFRQQLKTGNITEALAWSLTKAVDLKITTWVSSTEDTIETAQTKPGHRLRSRINTIEGEIENEIGDQFIGNGPYRELRQFHLEQVAQSHQIIQSNLKSLQKLFEVVIAMRSQSAATPVLETDAYQFESQLLPPAQELTSATLVTEPPASAVEAPNISPNSLTDHLVPAALSVAGVTAAFLAMPGDSPDELEEEEEDEEDEDDWDDSVLDLLESLPVESPDQTEDLDSDMDEDWRNFIDEDDLPEPEALDLPINPGWRRFNLTDFQPSPTSSELNIESLNAQKDEDLADLVTDNHSPESVVSESLVDQDQETLNLEEEESSPILVPPIIDAPNLQHDQDWEDLIEDQPASDQVTADLSENQGWQSLNLEDFRSPSPAAESNLEQANAEDDQDWGDLIEDELSPEPDHLIPSMESLDLEEEDEWDDWVVEESESLQATPTIQIDSLDVSGDNDWDDFDDNSDLFAAIPTPTRAESSSEGNEDWDDFAPDELEPYTPVIDVDANVGADFDLSDAFENLTPDESAIQETDHPDLCSENQNTDASTEQDLNGFSSHSETINLPPAADNDLVEVLFGDTEPQDTQNHPAADDDYSAKIREDELFADIQFEELTADASDSVTGSFTITPADLEPEVITQNSESLIVSEDDLEPHATSGEQRVPPPPPPSRLPSQNH